MEARRRELLREDELESLVPTVKAKSKMTKVYQISHPRPPRREAHLTLEALGSNMHHRLFKPFRIFFLMEADYDSQAEKELQKKQKAQSFQQSKAKGKVSKNASRWN